MIGKKIVISALGWQFLQARAPVPALDYAIYK